MLSAKIQVSNENTQTLMLKMRTLTLKMRRKMLKMQTLMLKMLTLILKIQILMLKYEHEFWRRFDAIRKRKSTDVGKM